MALRAFVRDSSVLVVRTITRLKGSFVNHESTKLFYLGCHRTLHLLRVCVAPLKQAAVLIVPADPVGNNGSHLAEFSLVSFQFVSSLCWC